MIGGALLISVRKEVPKLGGNRLRLPHLDNAKTNWKQKAVQPRLRALGSSQYGLMSRQRKTRRNPLSQKKRIPRPPTREMLIRSLILEEWAGQCMALTLFWPAARKKKKKDRDRCSLADGGTHETRSQRRLRMPRPPRRHDLPPHVTLRIHGTPPREQMGLSSSSSSCTSDAGFDKMNPRIPSDGSATVFATWIQKKGSVK